MDIKIPGTPINIDQFVTMGEEPLPDHLPKSLRDVEYLKSMNNYKDDPKLSPEENKKRREYYAKMEQYLKKKDTHTKSLKQKALDKKKAKIANKSRKKNRK